jgi:hypothetical protein
MKLPPNALTNGIGTTRSCDLVHIGLGEPTAPADLMEPGRSGRSSRQEPDWAAIPGRLSRKPMLPLPSLRPSG